MIQEITCACRNAKVHKSCIQGLGQNVSSIDLANVGHCLKYRISSVTTCLQVTKVQSLCILQLQLLILQ